MIQCLSFRRGFFLFLSLSLFLAGLRKKGEKLAAGVGQARVINANLVISVAPTASHGRNKYLPATVKTSSIAPSVYDPARSRHFITVSPALPSPFPVSFDHSI